MGWANFHVIELHGSGDEEAEEEAEAGGRRRRWRRAQRLDEDNNAYACRMAVSERVLALA
eukprot:1133539-Rhodomonas_salina.1